MNNYMQAFKKNDLCGSMPSSLTKPQTRKERLDFSQPGNFSFIQFAGKEAYAAGFVHGALYATQTFQSRNSSQSNDEIEVDMGKMVLLRLYFAYDCATNQAHEKN